MKRKLISLLLLLLPFFLFAYVDSYAVYDNNLDWGALYKVIKDNKSESEVESFYDKYISEDLSLYEKARAEYNMVRYYMDRENKAKAQEHYKKQEAAVKELDSDNSVLAEISKSELTSSAYYISHDIFTGMSNSSKLKKLYNEYSDEVYLVLNNAWRLIYTPGIAGGSSKKAIKILLPLLDISAELSTENRYSLYGALATAWYNEHDYSQAEEYLREALALYNGEVTLLKLKEKLENK